MEVEDAHSATSDPTITLKRSRSQFDPRLAEESIQEEKKEAHQQGYEEGIEKGRVEHLIQVVSKMMRMNQPDSIIAEVNELTIDQLEKVNAYLNQ